MSSCLDFSAHCGIIVGKAASRVGLVLRAFRSRDKKFMLSLYTTHIRPILEYNTEVWSPLFKKDIDLIKSIQKKFLKRISGFNELSFLERFHQCDLESLELRRIRRDLILTYKIVHGLINLPFDDYFVYAPDVGTRGHTRKLLVKRARLNIVKNFFSYRVISIWNSLPQNTISMPSLSTFKGALSRDYLIPHLKGSFSENI